MSRLARAALPVVVVVGAGAACLEIDLIGARCDATHPCPSPLFCVTGACAVDDDDGAGEGEGEGDVVGEGEGEGEGEGDGAFDEDADGFDDDVDNCPGTANDPSADADGDGVGDACDPRVNTFGDEILLFDGFNGAALDARWLEIGSAIDWHVEGGRLIADATGVGGQLLHDAFLLEDVAVEAQVRVVAVDDTDGLDVSTGVVWRASVAPLFDGYGCFAVADDANQTELTAFEFDDNVSTNAGGVAIEGLDAGAHVSRAEMAGAVFDCTWDDELVSVSDNQPQPAGRVGLHAQRGAIEFDYVVVYGIGL